MKPIQVMIVEDDPIWRKGIYDILHPCDDFHIAATASSKEEAIDLFLKHEIDVVLMDINLTDNHLDGLDAAMELMEIKETVKIIMLTSLSEEDIILESFSAGAVNFVNKLHFKEIPHVIRDAYHDQSAIHASAAQALRRGFQRMKKEEDQKLLTSSEKEILQLIHEGHTQTEIEGILFITKRTIKNHINHILKKMGVSSSKDAAKIAKKKKLF